MSTTVCQQCIWPQRCASSAHVHNGVPAVHMSTTVCQQCTLCNLLYTLYCLNLQPSTLRGKFMPLTNSTVSEPSAIYRASLVRTHVLPRAYAVRPPYKLCYTHCEIPQYLCCASHMHRKLTSLSLSLSQSMKPLTRYPAQLYG